MSHPPRRRSDTLALHGGSRVRATPLPYARQTIEADDIAAVSAALAADWITQGPAVVRFERALAERAGVRHAVAVASGTAALHLACRAAGFGAGDEVITAPLTFAATANAIVDRGALPVFADIDGSTLNLAPGAVKRVATSRTRAVLAVDFAGLPCEYDRLLAIAREHGWIVIADAAHSFGGASGDRPVGALADLTTVSFHPAKIVTTGEGGAVLTDRDDLAERMRAARHHGIRVPAGPRPWRYEIHEPGDNYRLTDFQSALGLSQLAKLDRFWTQRDRLARRYRERLGAHRSSSSRRSRRAGGTAGISSSSCFASSVSWWNATRSSRRCAPRTSGPPFTIRSSTITRSIESGSITGRDCAQRPTPLSRGW